MPGFEEQPCPWHEYSWAASRGRCRKPIWQKTSWKVGRVQVESFFPYLMENSTTPGMERAPTKLIASSSPSLTLRWQFLMQMAQTISLHCSNMIRAPVHQHQHCGRVLPPYLHPLHPQEGGQSQSCHLANPAKKTSEWGIPFLPHHRRIRDLEVWAP